MTVQFVFLSFQQIIKHQLHIGYCRFSAFKPGAFGQIDFNIKFSYIGFGHEFGAYFWENENCHANKNSSTQNYQEFIFQSFSKEFAISCELNRFSKRSGRAILKNKVIKHGNEKYGDKQ